ncbi:MAG: site-specific integrase [Anaerosomatales bacterium]|nr:site-specific integrase [Anaerosomatales bacterium]
MTRKRQPGRVVAKAANGEGSIYQHAKGYWVAAVTAEDPATGQKKRHCFYCKTQAEAKRRLKEALARVEQQRPVRDADRTLADWLAEWKRGALEASDRKPTTKSNYRDLSRLHLEPPPFGSIPLSKLRPSHIERLMLSLRDRGLSDATRQRVFNILRAALKDAVRDGLIAENPAERLKQPKVPRHEARFLTLEETRAVLEAAKDSRYYPVFALIAALGLRRGEALGLKWEDVDLEARVLRVRRTLSEVDGELVLTEPKTAKARRTLALSDGLVALLKEQRRRQIAERLQAGSWWTESGHVFTTEFGRPVHPSNLARTFRAAVSKAGVPGASLHTLRHSAATAWIEQGFSLKAVSELLGHADIRVTADVYGHVAERVQREAICKLADALGL